MDEQKNSRAREELRARIEANFEEEEMTISVEVWQNFRSLRFAMNRVPVEMVSVMDDYLWRHENILQGNEYRREYEKIPEDVRKKIHEQWALEAMEGLNGIYRWMERQISEGKVYLTPPKEPHATQPGTKGTQIHCQTVDNPHLEQ